MSQLQFQTRAFRREITHEAIRLQLQSLVTAAENYLEFPENLQDPPKTVELELAYELMRAKMLLEQK